MFNKFFKKQETPMAPAATPTPAPEKVFGPTKKKKNTYTITFNTFADPTMWKWCRNTPLAVVKKNGIKIENDGWIAATPFPNPGASEMRENFKSLKSNIGEKMATTIIEYLDMKTGTPVVTVFPTYVHIHDGYEENYQEHLNHASRKDLDYQIMMRRRALEKIDQR